jgi:curved DNA-binding protein CbpA
VPETRDPYLILQLHPSALPELVEAAYRTLARLHHPDHSEAPDADAAMADLNWAYATLREPALRAAYDKTKVAIPVDAHEPVTRQPAVASTSLSQRVAEAAAAAAERDAGGSAATTLDFGRYAGMSLREIARIEPGYLEWLRRHSSGLRYRHQIDQVLAALTPQRASSAE